MLKAITAIALIGVTGVGVTHVFAPSTASANDIASATKQLATTETKLKDAATKTGAQAGQVATDLDTPDRESALPKELQEFGKSTERLLDLREQLVGDSNTYETAAAAKLAEFDNESNTIADPATKRSMCALRKRTQEDINERIATTRATIKQLDAVLTKGNDLQHAAKCVLIADSLHQHGEDIDQTLQQAKTAATQYAATTNTLLARINRALAD